MIKLQKRLRALVKSAASYQPAHGTAYLRIVVVGRDIDAIKEAADALDAQAAEVARLTQELADYQANVSESMDRTTAYEAELKADRDHWRKLCQDGWVEVADGPVSRKLREDLASFMMSRGFATGHGDSHTDLLSELGPQIDDLSARLAEAERDAERLKRGLKFYAEGDHFQNDGAFDTVSGEPQNFWCDQEGSMVEDGTVAKKFLEGWDVDDDDNWIVPAFDAARGGA